jgi:16S rRNA (guanine527-N7)-methyltransferase
MSPPGTTLMENDAARAWIDAAFAPNAAQWAALDSYATLLATANAKQNLIAASTLPTLWARHLADSAQLLCFDGREGDGLWLDLGSGPGLPGLVVAILSERPVWLIESRALRCRFLEEAVATLGLGARVTVRAQRLEKVETIAAATISARAFAPLSELLTISARFSTAATRWLLPKGRNAVNELACLPQPWQRLFHVEQSVTDGDSGIIVGTGKIGLPGAGRRKHR